MMMRLSTSSSSGKGESPPADHNAPVANPQRPSLALITESPHISSSFRHSASLSRGRKTLKKYRDSDQDPFSPSDQPAPLAQKTTPVNSLRPSSSRKMLQVRPGTSHQSTVPPFPLSQPQSPSLESVTFQHIQETATKRISTLDYLRKAHEGRVYWFNTLLLTKADLQRISNLDYRKLARRATNYLLLGLSLPIIIDLYCSSPIEFLKTLSALLSEFESFQQRATVAGIKGRRTSSAADIGLPMGHEGDVKSVNGNGGASSANTNTSFPTSENDLHPGEEYTYLLTPSLPFEPDICETFATLCDVLIDCYTKLIALISSPRDTSPVIAEYFAKVDSRIRKLLVQGVVKEFEDVSRAGVRSEISGVGRVVLGGLI
ncbi:Bgt-3276 [Blumeria graminis f. sp. tritici]|uniref:Bgt-3276 n=2 Tax=Blumeria graminis f. sp. tritici TaxID=62690 RepID=A0A9X9MPK4_BLUGR|nr:hypothetical protein BGT96224_3276 [Blumeria graminis f. sp. tritici 96224]VDB94003.1 Bgt-3276 [Blumeria graminis f. sp. tritici]